MWLLRDISLPHLAAHKARTVLTLLGIAIGVGAIVATSSVTDAVFRAFRRTIEATAGRAELQIQNGGAGVPDMLMEEVKRFDGVAGAAGMVGGFVAIAGNDPNSLAIFGVDLLADEEHEAQVPRSAVHIDDELTFLNRLDSVALAAGFARTHGYGPGSTIDVIAPEGRRQLVVRGLVDAAGPAALYGGAVGLMDLPAAQRLLGKAGRLDRIDVRLAAGSDPTEVAARLRARFEGDSRVQDTATAGARGEDLLCSLRVAPAIAGLIAALVGFFIIYHTMSVSVVQRRREIALLNAFGVSGWSLLRWLAIEALALGVVAAFVGLGVGLGLAHLAVATFATVTTVWVQITPEPVRPEPWGAVLGIGIGVFTTLIAAMASGWSVITSPPARHLRLAADAPTPSRGARRAVMLSVAGFGLMALMLYAAPRTLPYAPLVAFVFAVNCLALTSFALLSPAVALGLGRAVTQLADRRPGLSLLLAGSSIRRTPAAPAAVVAAIVIGLGWSLAQASLTASMERSWLTWLDQHYASDLLVTAGATTVSFLTDPPVDEGMAQQLRAIPGVREVQGVRNIEIDVRGRPVVLLGLDNSAQGLPLVAGSWRDVATRFWAGEGLAVSDNLAHRAGLDVGQTLELPTPTGVLRLPILGRFADYQSGGDLGCVALSRQLVRNRWNDALLTRARVWVAPGADIEGVRGEIDQRLGTTYGVHALTFAEARAAVTDLVRSAFSISYALVVIALVISFIGVLNFLLAAVLERGREFDVLVAMGATSRQIGATIVSEGALVGVVGALVGIVGGVVLSRIIVLHSVPMVNGWHFTWVLPVGSAATFVLLVVGLAAIAGLVPARLAQRSRRAVV